MPARSAARAWLPLFVTLAACAPTIPDSTGGTTKGSGPFGRGVFTINENESYDSTNISLVGLNGDSLSKSFLAAGLSGDVSAPTMPCSGEDIVLLDRWYSIVTWANVRTGQIREQLHADGDELARNPWDYLPISPSKAYVTRYDPWPGHTDHGDIIVVNPQTANVSTPITERIDIAQAIGLAPDYTVHPARGAVIDNHAYVVTVNATPEYAYTSSHLVVIDTTSDQVTDVLELTGLHDCNAIAVSPRRDALAVACAGDLVANGAAISTNAGIAVLSTAPLAETERLPSSALGGKIPGFSISYATENDILALMVGNVAENIDDTATLIRLGSQSTRDLYRAPPIQIGSVLCAARVDGDLANNVSPPACFVTDAERGVLVRFNIRNGVVSAPMAMLVDDIVGLPPRYLGQF